MASIIENKNYYAGYDWSGGGREWSKYWGSTSAMWYASIYPRISRFLPAGTVVEIGAGHGRVSRLLYRYVRDKLILTDFLEQCVEECNKLFIDSTRVTCILTDGNSLPGVADNSVDLVVSFYSLVDADVNTIRAYTEEFRRVLKRDGAIFLHHSNAAAYFDADAMHSNKSMQLLSAYRDVSMSARVMRQLAQEHDLLCIEQECLNWDVKEVLSDCFSVMVRPDSKWVSKPVAISNTDFRREMRRARLVGSRVSQ